MNIYEKSFSPALLQDLKDNLANLRNEHSAAATLINRLISTIDTYLQDNTISHPEIIKELQLFYDKLSPVVTNENAKSISDLTKKCCRECMFHMDDCFINVIFLIFEAVRLQTFLEPNKIRPTLRFEATKKSINQLAESIKAKNQDKKEP